jgi:predicted HicB family RNase H-like nuclease
LRQPKARKVGRPKLAKGHAKAHIVPVRFNPELLRRVESAAKASGQNVSEWIRSALDAATN